MNEKEPKLESSEDVLGKIKEGLLKMKEAGTPDPEVISLLSRWIAEEEKSSEGPRGHIELCLKQGRLYAEVGFQEQAAEQFFAAAFQAQQEGFEELKNSILDEAEALDLEQPEDGHYE